MPVSIHTRHYWRVKPLHAGCDGNSWLGFNPHPPLLAGETEVGFCNVVCPKVSIHTRHYWRVKRGRLRGCEVDGGFNPHPPLLAGETVGQRRRSETCTVSIHTRHYWRVKLGPQLPGGATAQFQSTPAITGG